MAIMEIDMASLMSSITVKVKVGPTTRIRMWLGARVIGLGARMFGCNVEIVIGGGGEG
jgi:hypothetical protein